MYVVTERIDYGMPSSHSQFMGFLMGMFPHILDLTIFSQLPKFLAYSMAIAGSALVSYSRLYLGYHDSRQVVVGFFMGLGLGSLWSKVVYCSAYQQMAKYKNK